MTATLAIDTASDTIAVAFVDDGVEPVVAVESRPREHSTSLLRLIDEVCGPRLADVGTIVVVRGPGAYAGIRVGIATAEGLSLALGVPVTGVDTLRAVVEAARLAGAAGRIVAVHPAGRGDYAAQAFDEAGSALDSFISRLPLPGETAVAGEGAGAFGGLEVGTEQRLLGALKAFRNGLTGDAEALYVREPHITLAKTK